MRFKVGDIVRITRLSKTAGYNKLQIDAYKPSIGDIATIIAVNNEVYELDREQPTSWLDDELELAKEYFIKQVIDDL